jgi:hypothetical protein
MAKKRNKEDEERYVLTPKGYLSSVLEKLLHRQFGALDFEISQALDSLELYMRRHYVTKDGGHAAIVLEDDGGLVFRTVYAQPAETH